MHITVGFQSCSQDYFHICPLWPWPPKSIEVILSLLTLSAKFDEDAYKSSVSVKHLLFVRTLFSCKFARPYRHEIKVLANISYTRFIVRKMDNRENKVSWIYQRPRARENKVSRKISVLQYVHMYDLWPPKSTRFIPLPWLTWLMVYTAV